MEDDLLSPSPNESAPVTNTFQPNRTLRVKLAKSLQLQAESVARHQGVSVGFLVTKAIEEKIERVLQRRTHDDPSCRLHLVSRKETRAAG